MSTISIAIEQNRAGFFLTVLEKIMAKVEQFRVRNHLRIVERELRSREISHLSAELKRKREENIARLHEYWTEGVFPKNSDFFDQRVPYFKDNLGTPCAMAYLIEQSGRQDLVNEVTKTNNHVFINDIKDGPVLDWIRKSGLTQDEAARVQPQYGPCGFAGCPVDPLGIALPWILASVIFIALEWLSYKISSWIAPASIGRRLLVWFYFTLNNAVLALVIYAIISDFVRSKLLFYW